MTLIESETNNNPFTAPSPITLSTQPDPAAVIKNIYNYIYILHIIIINGQ